MFVIKNKRGVTLIEVLVSIAILSIVLLMSTNLFSYSLRAYKNDDVQLQIQQDARIAIKKISGEVRSKEIISVGSSTIELKNAANDRIIIQQGDTNGNNMNVLYLNTNGVLNPIIYNLYSISFNYDINRKIVTVNLSIQKPGTSNKYNVSAKLYSRVDS